MTTTYPMLNDTHTPIRVTLTQLYNRFHKRLVERLRWTYNLDVTEAEDQAQHAWLLLTENLNQHHNYLARKSYGYVWKWLQNRAMPTSKRTQLKREVYGPEIMFERHARHRPNRGHAHFAEIIDFWLDYKQAAHILAKRYEHNDIMLWALYLTVTGRKPTTSKYHDTTTQRAQRRGHYCLNWCHHTRQAAVQITGYSQDSLRDKRRKIQHELSNLMQDYG